MESPWFLLIFAQTFLWIHALNIKENIGEQAHFF
jgi:hypothetical protein